MQTVIYLVISDAGELTEMERVLRDAHLRYRSYSSAKAFLDKGPQTKRGCVVAELSGDIHGLDLRRELGARQLHLPMLLLTHKSELAPLFEAAKSGDVALLERPITPDSLVVSIMGLLETQRHRVEEESELQAIESRIARLTQRESEVTMRVMQGLSNKEISAELGISARTVEKHRATVMKKLGANNLAELCCMRRHCERLFTSYRSMGGKLR